MKTIDKITRRSRPPLLALRARAGVVIALAFALLPLAAAQGPKAAEHFRGQVVPLAKLLDEQGVKLDADAAAVTLMLKTADGKVYPLVKDRGARMFFKDPRLLNRPMRLTGRLLPGSQFLQVVAVHSEVKGKLHDVYYWCDICTIRAFEPGICECCGMPVEFREEPARMD
jgi:hypothetical protein